MRRSSWIALAIATLAALLLAGRTVTELVVDRAWFSALNAEPVFWEQFTDSVILRGGLWLAGALFAFANLYAVRRTIRAVAVPSRVANIEMTAMLPARRLLAFTLIMAVIVGLVLTIPFDDWTSVALARHGMPFNEMENYFQHDLGFYVYWLPLEEAIYVWALLAIVVMIAVVVVLYALTRSLRVDGRRIITSTHARRHLTVLGALVMLMLAWSYRLDGFDLLRAGSGNDGLFLRVDHVVTLKVDFVLGWLSLFAAVTLLRAGWVGQVRTATATLTVVLIGALAVRHLLPPLLATGSTLGAPLHRDDDYVATRALVTRRAYDVDGIVAVNRDSSSRAMLEMHLSDVPQAVGVWDAGPLTRALGPPSDVSLAVAPVAWSATANGIDGTVLQRPAIAGNPWTLIGISGVDVDDRGAPIRDGADVAGTIDSAAIVVAEDVSAGSITEPLIAPGATGHRLVIDSATRVVGARLSTLSSRVSHAWATRDPRLLARNEDEPVPTLVLFRDVRERVRRLAPIFAQGEDIIPLLNDGSLYWAIELYSASDTYPLSEHWVLSGEERSYFRHAATALVDSRTGRVRLVTVRRPDPLARTWMALAPALFVPVNQLPASLAAQLPPPTDGVIAQTRAFARYGSSLEGPLPRHLPDSALANEVQPPLLFKARMPIIGWSVPLLNGPEQISGLAIAIGGALRGARWMSLKNVDARWGLLADRLHAALDSARLSLAEGGKREPSVTYGRVRTVFADGAPVMVQPLYVTRLNGSQALARIALYAGGVVTVAPTTADAVRNLQGPSTSHSSDNGAGSSNVPLSAASRQAAVVRLYETMRAAMRRGDWARFGTAFDSLGAYVGRPPQ
jgi:uncharacterized membrane protein (UPF0182 family)